jgi:hypothetical protein
MISNTEADIWKRLIQPEGNDLAPDAAHYFLSLDFGAEDHQRMAQLAERARAGTLTADDRDELNAYLRAADVVALLQSKARRSLKKLLEIGMQPAA